MSGFLLDTSVLSAFAPDKPPLPDGVRRWLIGRSGALHLSAVTFLELAQGASKLRRAGATARAERLSAWLDRLALQYRRRIFDLDLALARDAGELSDAARAVGRHPGLADIIIGATAVRHSVTLLTRNLKHFAPLGIDALDPFELQP